ncbi:MAG: hypothetical protein V6Z78_01200 [Holosporaceae bacterium]
MQPKTPINRLLKDNLEAMWNLLAQRTKGYQQHLTDTMHCFKAPTHLPYFNMCFQRTEEPLTDGDKRIAHSFFAAPPGESQTTFLQIATLKRTDKAVHAETLRRTFYLPLQENLEPSLCKTDKTLHLSVLDPATPKAVKQQAHHSFFESMTSAFNLPPHSAHTLLEPLPVFCLLYTSYERQDENVGHLLVFCDPHKVAGAYMPKGSPDVQQQLLSYAAVDLQKKGLHALLFPYNPTKENPIAPLLELEDIYRADPFVSESLWQQGSGSPLYTAAPVTAN